MVPKTGLNAVEKSTSLGPSGNPDSPAAQPINYSLYRLSYPVSQEKSRDEKKKKLVTKNK
jgi:hypothetical protein